MGEARPEVFVRELHPQERRFSVARASSQATENPSKAQEATAAAAARSGGLLCRRPPRNRNPERKEAVSGGIGSLSLSLSAVVVVAVVVVVVGSGLRTAGRRNSEQRFRPLCWLDCATSAALNKEPCRPRFVPSSSSFSYATTH